MIVEFDQTGENRPLGFNNGNAREIRRSRLRTVVDDNDAALINLNDSIAFGRKRVIHGDYTSR